MFGGMIKENWGLGRLEEQEVKGVKVGKNQVGVGG